MYLRNLLKFFYVMEKDISVGALHALDSDLPLQTILIQVYEFNGILPDPYPILSISDFFLQ